MTLLVLWCFMCAVLLSPPQVDAAQACAASTQMAFKKVADPNGIRSYINSAGGRVQYAVGVVMPPVVIQFNALDSNKLSLGYDFSLDGLTVQASVFPALILGGRAALINRGEAIFSSLVLQEASSPSNPSNMTFSLVTTTGKTLSISTGSLVAVSQAAYASPASVQFSNAGYLTRDGVGRTIPFGVALPTFSLEVLNAVGLVLTTPSATVAVAATGGTTWPTSFSSLTINNLTVSTTTGSVVLTFTVTVGSWSASTSTGILAVLGYNNTGVVRNQFMLFDTVSSFITEENQGNTAVLGIALPAIVIRLYNSLLEEDTSNTGLIITATCNQATLSGAEALVVNGVASFDELTFVDVAPTAAVIVFAAGTQGNLAVAAATLLSGALAVSTTAVKAKHIQFSAFTVFGSGTTLWYVEKDTTGVFTLPDTMVQLMDSAYRPDPLANGVAVNIAPLDSSAATAVDSTKLTLTSADGIVAFRGVKFTASSSGSIEFVVTSGDRTELLTAPLLPLLNPLSTSAGASQALSRCYSASSTTCTLSLAFASKYGAYTSLVYAAEQQAFTTVGATLPLLVVELRDAFGVAVKMPASVAPTLVAFTGSDPLTNNLLLTTNNANQAFFLNGRYYFNCLQFTSAPSGLVRVQFAPLDTSGNQLLGIIPSGPLRTGFISVAAVTSANYGIRFATGGSFISFEGQQSSAVLNVAMPPFSFEFVDSLGNLDTSDSSATIVVTTSTGQLDTDGATVAVVNGQATFSDLRFTALSGTVPKLTFAVVGSATLGPVVGNTLTTGSFFVSALPVTAFEVAFHPQLLANNNVTTSFAPFVFTNLSDIHINVVVVVRDSAHQRSRGLGALGITMLASSDEAILVNPTTVALDPACDCMNYTIRISAYKGPYLPAYVAFTVATGPPKLVGKFVVVGPITATGPASTSTCTSNVQTPAVIGEFLMTIDVFSNAGTGMNQKIADLLGITKDRVLIDNTTTTSISRENHSTLVPWVGTKAVIRFGDPTATSTNRQTSADLAATWVALRPGCDGASINLQAVYYQKDDNSCNPTSFKSSLAATKQCAENSDICQCYSSMVVPDWAVVCAEEPTLKNDLVVMCNTLADCKQTEITSLCDTIIVSQPVNLVWLWGTLGGVGGVGVILAALYVTGFFRGKPKVKLEHQFGLD